MFDETKKAKQSAGKEKNPGKKEGEKKKSGRGLIWLAVLMIVLLCLAISAYLAYTYVMGMTGPPLTVSTDEPTGLPIQPQPTEPGVPGQPPPVTGGTCGQTGMVTVMVLAYDTKIEWPYGADAIRLVQVDYGRNRVRVFSLPRDLWVNLPGQADPYPVGSTLGALFQTGLDQFTGSTAEIHTAAASMVAQALYDNFNIIPDDYITIELNIFATMVDTVGGIDINPPVAYAMETWLFPAGPQHWDGATTLAYVRARNRDEPEWSRLERQNLVLRALQQALLNPAILPQVPNLANQFQGSVVTDLNLGQITGLSCMVTTVQPGEVQFSTIAPEMVLPGPEGTLVPDTDLVRQLLEAWMAGN